MNQPPTITRSSARQNLLQTLQHPYRASICRLDQAFYSVSPQVPSRQHGRGGKQGRGIHPKPGAQHE